jgi:hypothetical protein
MMLLDSIVFPFPLLGELGKSSESGPDSSEISSSDDADSDVGGGMRASRVTKSH